MAQVIVTFCEQLRCGKCDQVLLKLDDPALIAANQGVPIEQVNPFIRGEIDDYRLVSGAAIGCGCSAHEYTISYDEQLLLDPSTLLRACDIERVCCADCLIDYVDTIVPSLGISTLVDNGDGTFTHTNELAVVTIFNALSTLVDNLNNTYTYTDETGAVTAINVAHTLTNPALTTNIVLTRPDGSQDIIDICPIVDACLAGQGEVTVATQLPIQGDGTIGDPIALLLSTDLGNVLSLGTDSGLYGPSSVLNDNGDNTFDHIHPIDGITTVNYAHTIEAGPGTTLRLTQPNAQTIDVDLCPIVATCGSTVSTQLPIQGDGSPGDPIDLLLSADLDNNLSLGTDSGLYHSNVVTTTAPLQRRFSGVLSSLISIGGTGNTALFTEQAFTVVSSAGNLLNWQFGGVNPELLITHQRGPNVAYGGSGNNWSLSLYGGNFPGAPFEPTNGAAVIVNGNTHGTNPARLQLKAGNVAAGAIEFFTGLNVLRYFINNAGHFLPQLTDTYDIGSAANRVREVHAEKVFAGNDIFGETPAGAVDGLNVTFTLAGTPVANSERVYLNGLRQKRGAGDDYTIAGNTITFNAAPLAGDTLLVDYVST